MKDEHQGFSFSEAAVYLLSIVLVIQIGWLAYSIGKSIARQPYPHITAQATETGKSGGASMEAADEGSAPANGQSVYASSCAGCHGADGSGGLGPSLQAAADWSLEEFSKATLDGSTPDGRELAPVMPRFANTGFGGTPADPAQLEALHNYLKTLH